MECRSFGLFVDFGEKSAAGAIDCRVTRCNRCLAEPYSDNCGGNGCNVNGLSNHYTSILMVSGARFRFGSRALSLQSFSWSTAMMVSDWMISAWWPCAPRTSAAVITHWTTAKLWRQRQVVRVQPPIPVTEPGMLGLMGWVWDAWALAQGWLINCAFHV